MPALTVVTLLLLAAAICAAWLPAPLSTKATSPAPGPMAAATASAMLAPRRTSWLPLLLALVAAGCGIAAQVLAPWAPVWPLLLAGLVWLMRDQRGGVRTIAAVLAAVLALALATHRLPGFYNPLLLDGVVLSDHAPAFSQYGNLDKGAVGLVLVALLCRRMPSWRALGQALRRAAPVAAVTLVTVFGLGLALGLVQPAFKLSPVVIQFLLVNLFFTVVAEEAFFRGFVQQPLTAALARYRWGAFVAVLCSALLFGLVHLGGGPLYALLATVAGLGYAWAYARTGIIEASILLHLLVNGVHVIGFTYPYFLKAHGA